MGGGIVQKGGTGPRVFAVGSPWLVVDMCIHEGVSTKVEEGGDERLNLATEKGRGANPNPPRAAGQHAAAYPDLK